VEFGAVVVVAAIDDGVVDPASVELVVDVGSAAESSSPASPAQTPSTNTIGRETPRIQTQVRRDNV